MQKSRIFKLSQVIPCVLAVLYGGTAQADGVTFKDIATLESSGIDFKRKAAPNDALVEAFRGSGAIMSIDAANRAFAPANPHGAPGVAVIDFDNDGDLDLYVSNALGVANSLYSNQLVETGELKFEDHALRAGVAATDQDTTGVCFGDIDNDGDKDIYSLGNYGTGNRLFENQGDGTFADISDKSNTDVNDKHPANCAMGDVNGDGRLDIVVGNTYDNWDHRLPLVTFDGADLLERNYLYINKGGNKFVENGINAGLTSAQITWGISLVDYDKDGDVDLITADDQGAKAPAIHGGVDDGYVRIFNNDGKGNFTNVTEASKTDRVGAWMGLSFGDFNQDDKIDIFSTNVGYYLTAFMGPVLDFPTPVGDWQSGWFLGQEDGSFTFPGVDENMLSNPFGWGNSVADYDNDGDSDIIYHGGMDMVAFGDASNPGVVLENDGNAHFSYDKEAFAHSVNHSRRLVKGMAVGDMNRDGFMDVISVSSKNWPEVSPLLPYVPDELKIGTPFDDQVFMWPQFVPVNPQNFLEGFVWSGLPEADGTLAVEVNSADNNNKWVKVGVQGSVDLTPRGKVNRGGVGAIVKFTSKKGKSAMWPVAAGSSYGSQDSQDWVFGLGKEKKGTLEILWPGGVRNKLYGVKAGESILFPEIPCDYSTSKRFYKYASCVRKSLHDLRAAGVIKRKQSRRFLRSAIKAYFRARKSK